MPLIESHAIDARSYVDVIADRDPAVAHPGGIVTTEIYLPERSLGKVSVSNVRHLQILLAEEAYLPNTVDNDFPVFVSNITSVSLGNPGTPSISARIRLPYCVSRLSPKGKMFFTHSPELHGQDVVDTAVSLARYVLGLPIGLGLWSQPLPKNHRQP